MDAATSAIAVALNVCSLTAASTLGPDAVPKVVYDRAVVVGTAAMCSWHMPSRTGYTGLRIRDGRWERVYDFESADSTVGGNAVPSPGTVGAGRYFFEDPKNRSWNSEPWQYGPSDGTLENAGFSVNEGSAFSGAFDDIRSASERVRKAFPPGSFLPIITEEPWFFGVGFFVPDGSPTFGLYRPLSEGFEARFNYPKGMVSTPTVLNGEVKRSLEHTDGVDVTLETWNRTSFSFQSPSTLTIYAPYIFSHAQYVATISQAKFEKDGSKTPEGVIADRVAVETSGATLRVSLPASLTVASGEQVLVSIEPKTN